MRSKELPPCIILSDTHIIIPQHPRTPNVRPETYVDIEGKRLKRVFISKNIPPSALENASVLIHLKVRRIRNKIRLS